MKVTDPQIIHLLGDLTFIALKRRATVEELKKKTSKKKLTLCGGLGFLSLVIFGEVGTERAGDDRGPTIQTEYEDREPARRHSFAPRIPSWSTVGSKASSPRRTPKGTILYLDDQERQGFVGEIGSEPLISDLVQILKNVIALGWIKTVIFKKLLLE